MKNDVPRQPQPQQQQQRLTLEQLQDVRDRLRQPLAKQTVLIPFGSKAFFPGRLAPSSRETVSAQLEEDDPCRADGAATANQNDPEVAASLRECVIVRLPDGTEQEMARREALDHLQKEMEECKKESARAANKANKKAAVKTTPAGARISRNSSPKVTAKTPSNTPQKETNGLSAPLLPFIEIREEINDAGEAVRSETIDVTEQLQYLKTKGGEEPVPLKSELSPQKQHTARDGEEEVDEVMAAPDPPDRMKSLSDSEYDVLSARLDELAKMEEQAETNKVINLKSSKILQSKGWSKGFLNSKPKQSKEKVTSKTKSSAPATSETSTGDHPTITQSSAAATVLNQPEDAPSSSNKTVAFGGTEIREIPRVGERSVRDAIQRPPSRPLDGSVFSGVVQETQTAVPSLSNPLNNKAVSRFAQQQLRASGGSSAQQHQNQLQSPKKMSRFSQERQQGLR